MKAAKYIFTSTLPIFVSDFIDRRALTNIVSVFCSVVTERSTVCEV